MKSGSASFPFYGIELVVIEPTVEGSGDTSIRIVEGNGVNGILAIKTHWPSMVRTRYWDSGPQKIRSPRNIIYTL
jgi:acetyl-CoA synthetase